MNVSKIVPLIALCCLVVACDSPAVDKSPAQGVAIVNGAEITIHQLNAELVSQAYAADIDDEPSAEEVLNRLIDQELLVQQAEKLSLERTPDVMLELERSRRQILARSYLEQYMATIGEPEAAEIEAYFVSNPLLFSQRRQYDFVQIVVELPDDVSTPTLADVINENLAAADSIPAFVSWLDTQEIAYFIMRRIETPNQLEPPILEALSTMSAGEFARIRGKDGIVVLQLNRLMNAPLTQSESLPEIRQLLTDQRRIDIAESELSSLRERAKITILLDDVPSAAASKSNNRKLTEGLSK